MTDSVLFLDVDGPLIPHRCYLLPENHGCLVSRFDPVMVAVINRVLRVSDTKLVISSTWRNGGRIQFESLMVRNNLPPRALHTDWATKLGSEKRSVEIKEWLARHPEVEHYAAIDDELDVGDLPGGIVCSFENGMMRSHITRMVDLLDINHQRFYTLGPGAADNE